MYSSVRWSKMETSRLKTEEHQFKINLYRAKNHQKLDLSACPWHHSILRHECIGIPKAYQIEIRSFRRIFSRMISIREDMVQLPMMLRIRYSNLNNQYPSYGNHVQKFVAMSENMDPRNPVMIVCDEKVKELFGCESISAMGIPEALVKHHLFEQ
ncbi:unnamed protein product [Lactuca saligna]|uniref:DM2 domain-containing protein n=1 Tax=Lactuca saligna TaxID=75948 RepID=A0AA35V259_LACSI|nr:unnamed protein product [Lactuca saligna]